MNVFFNLAQFASNAPSRLVSLLILAVGFGASSCSGAGSPGVDDQPGAFTGGSGPDDGMAAGGTSSGGAPGGGGLGTGGAPLIAAGGTPTEGSGGSPSVSELLIEENAPGQCSVDGVVEATNAGFTGAGYLNANNALGAGASWSLYLAEAGEVSLSWRHANAGEDRPAQLSVDGNSIGGALSFPSSGLWTTWADVSTAVSLEAGTHTLSLAATSAGGLSNIDSLLVSGSGLSAGSCESDPPDEDPPDGTTPITLWLAGDSTVANGNTPCPSGWGKFIGDELNDNVTVVNSAVGGRSVRTWLYDVSDVMGTDNECTLNSSTIQTRWTDMLNQMGEGDYLFIQFGINDGSATCPRHVGGAVFKEEYAMMAQAAFERGAQPVFLTPVSAIKCSGSSAVASRGFITETFDVGAAEDVPVIDLHQLSINLYNQLGFCPAAAGGVSASTTGPVGDFFCDDHTHFSDIGAAQIAAVVAQAVEDAGLGLGQYRE